MALDLRTGSSEMLAGAVRAHQALARLAELAEDLRILSLNAELAAGRAGEQGRSIRVLTLATRELVRQLTTIAERLGELKATTYGASAGALKTHHRLRIIERAARLQHDDSTLAGLNSATERFLALIADDMSQVADCIQALSQQASRVSAIAVHAGTIATNIAIEAASAGQHTTQFLTVSQTMQRYAEELRRMTEEARGALSRVQRAGGTLRGHPADGKQYKGAA